MPTIYVVTSGEYSDYSINALFTTKELAEAYIDNERYQSWSLGYDIEEYELDAQLPVYRPSLYLSVKIYEDGTCSEPLEKIGDITASESTWMRIRKYMHSDSKPSLELTIWGTNHDKVRKVFSERKARYMADQSEWPANTIMREF